MPQEKRRKNILTSVNEESDVDVRYGLYVVSNKKPGEDILKSLTPEKCELLHMAVGLAGEVGEFLDAVKRHVFYDKPIDRENAIEELGDIEFYSSDIRRLIGAFRIDVLRKNIDKLNKRYNNGYSDKEAHERADKIQSTESPVEQIHDQTT